MSKTNETCRELTVDELDGVSGGALALSHEATHSSSSGGGGGVDFQPISIFKLLDRSSS